MPINLNTASTTASSSETCPSLEWAEYKWDGIWTEYKWDEIIALPQWEAFNKGTGAWKPVRAATWARRGKRVKCAGEYRFQYGPSDDPIQLTVYLPLGDEQALPSSEQVRAYHLLCGF